MNYEKLQSQYRHVLTEINEIKRQKQDMEVKLLNTEKLLTTEKNTNAGKTVQPFLY